MKGIILAAGRGSRMKGATEHQPKCMVTLANQPLIHWQVGSLKQAGVQEIGIVTGYKAELLEQFGYPTFHNPNWANTNMVASLMSATSWLETETCLISYSDIVYHPAIVERLVASTAWDITITYDALWQELWTLRNPDDPLDDAESFKLNEQGELLEVGQRVHDANTVEGQYMGLLKITPAGWTKISDYWTSLDSEAQYRLDMTSLLNQLIQRGITIGTVQVQGQWCEVDNEQDQAIYENCLHQTEVWTHDWRALPATLPC